MGRIIISAWIYLSSSRTHTKERCFKWCTLRNAVRSKRLILDLGQKDLHKKERFSDPWQLNFTTFLLFVLRYHHVILSSRTVQRDLTLSIWALQEQADVNCVWVHTDQMSENTAIDWLASWRILTAYQSNHHSYLSIKRTVHFYLTRFPVTYVWP
jgi:hypothetical protein